MPSINRLIRCLIEEAIKEESTGWKINDLNPIRDFLIDPNDSNINFNRILTGVEKINGSWWHIKIHKFNKVPAELRVSAIEDVTGAIRIARNSSIEPHTQINDKDIINKLNRLMNELRRYIATNNVQRKVQKTLNWFYKRCDFPVQALKGKMGLSTIVDNVEFFIPSQLQRIGVYDCYFGKFELIRNKDYVQMVKTGEEHWGEEEFDKNFQFIKVMPYASTSDKITLMREIERLINDPSWSGRKNDPYPREPDLRDM